MALKDFPQPEIIEISDSIRLRRYDGNFGLFLPGYQNPMVYQNSEGIFDTCRKCPLTLCMAAALSIRTIRTCSGRFWRACC